MVESGKIWARAGAVASEAGAAPFRPAARRSCGLELGAAVFLADASGALWHEDERTLIVADLHLEKGSSLARRGMMLPPYDTPATLAALAAVIAHYDPRCVISLGDGFHDSDGAERLDAECRTALRAMQAGRDWVWVAGNHDPAAPAGLPGIHVEACEVAGVKARHEPGSGLDDSAQGEIAGHLHPVARIVGRGGGVRRRCFATDERRCVLPAFGAYAGGLDLRAAAFSAVFDRARLKAIVIGEGRVHVFHGSAIHGQAGN
ncbi:putative phosphoesterase [Rhizobiales bacterium GAS113]|nr:putative phosphoesterase [Rhizobiales bacterium GAS113]